MKLLGKHINIQGYNWRYKYIEVNTPNSESS